VNSSRSPESFAVALEGTSPPTTALHYPASEPAAGATIIIAHGAGAGQRSPFLIDLAEALAARGFDAVTFNFLYTEQKRRLPDRAPALEACYAAVIDAVRGRIASSAHVFIGGKSMGGRIATQVAAATPELPIDGLVLFGYPLHPPGRPDRRRDAHLPHIGKPMLIVQGSRDTFGTPGEFETILDALGPLATLHVVEGGDHSFKVSRNAERQAAVDEDVRRTAAEWMQAVMRSGSATAPRPR
jgi:hypothetical protein